MLWVAAFLSLIIWVLGWASGFLGFRIHLFLGFALLAALAALLPPRSPDGAGEDDAPPAPGEGSNANSMPAVEEPGTEP